MKEDTFNNQHHIPIKLHGDAAQENVPSQPGFQFYIFNDTQPNDRDTSAYRPVKPISF